jgi:hypothetical protein
MRDASRRIGATVVWLFAVVVIALGAAGLATATPSAVLPAGRPGLTDTADAAVTRQLDAVERDLALLAVSVDSLGTQARGALSALVGGTPGTADAAIATGNALVAEIGSRSNLIAGALAAVPFVGGPEVDLHLSPAVQARYARLSGALAATRGLDASWARLTSDAVTATNLSQSLAEHDRLVGVAAERGRAARYKEALTYLDLAAEQIKTSDTLRTALANTVDVTVLDQWLQRNESYDTALRGLYVALSKVGGRVTDTVRNAIAAAIAAEKEARTHLPPDSRGLIVIIAEIGRGGMNGAVIAIEEAKAQLSDAMQSAPSDAPVADPSAAPSSAP